MVWPFSVGVEVTVGVSPTRDFSFWRRHHAHTAHNAGDSTGAVGELMASGARPTHANTFDTTPFTADAGAAGALARLACGATTADCGESVLAATAGGGGAARCTDASLSGASLTTDRVGCGDSVGDGALLSAADGVSATPLGGAVVVNDDRFGFLGVGADAGDDQSVPDLLTGVVPMAAVVSLAGVVGSGVPGAEAVVGSGPESAPAEESLVPNVDVCGAPEKLNTTFGPDSLTVDDDSDDESVDDTDVFDDADVLGDEESADTEPDPTSDDDESDDVWDVDVDSEEDADEESAAELDELESDGSANATPGVVATATPTPKATANPPTRPIYLA
jgi:hypothetical protein